VLDSKAVTYPLALALLCAGCSDDAPSGAGDASTPDGAARTDAAIDADGATDGNASECRSFPAEGSSTFNVGSGEAQATFSGAFDSATHTLTTTHSDGADFEVSLIYTYASAAAFVDEGKAVGLLSRTGEEITGVGTYAYTYEDGRVVGRSKSNGEETIVFSAWDAEQRPTAGTFDASSCTGIALSLAYDDAARTATWSLQAGSGADSASSAPCPSSDHRWRDSFDEDNNLIKREEDVGSPEARVVFEITGATSTGEVCK